MKLPDRTFEYGDLVRGQVPLWIACVGPQHSGKTFSALRLALGMQRVIGGDVALIDTEAGRGQHYADFFKVKYVPFPPPHSALDYLLAIEQALSKGARVLIIDTMTHEHTGEGGMMDQSEQVLDKKSSDPQLLERYRGDEERLRQAFFQFSLIKPKAQRKLLNYRIEQLKLNAIFCFRAQDKIKPQTGKQPLALGWQPETTNPLFYMMTAAFLLPPYSDGFPQFLPEHEAEKLYVKSPAQFRGWFKPGLQLTEDLGEKMARWAAGGLTERSEAGRPAPPPPAAASASLLDEIKAAIVGAFPAGAKGREGKLAALQSHFGVKTWAEVERLPESTLRACLADFQAHLPGAPAQGSLPG